MKQLTSYEGLHCANCGAAMQGEFCHECGQSIHSVLKPMHHMIEETVETVLHVDSRIVHTVPPLLLKPGFLTLEYFAGRRMRYIAPFRLMFVLCLLSFFVAHLAVDQLTDRISGETVIQTTPEGDTGAAADFVAGVKTGLRNPVKVTGEQFSEANSPAEVRHLLERELKMLPQISAYGVLSQQQIEQAAEELQRRANARLVELGEAPMPASSVILPPIPEPATDKESSTHISWLPQAANDRLTALSHRLHTNWRAFKDGDAATRAEARQRMINGVFGKLPAAMFVLVPLFAGMLKLFYVFRRRLYMEHLIVALHSHAFMFLSLLLIITAGMLSTWLRPHAVWASDTMRWVQTLLMLWVPAYLLIMQKRVYRQGWAMTLLKFWFIGWFYFWLLMLALMVAAALGMAH